MVNSGTQLFMTVVLYNSEVNNFVFKTGHLCNNNTGWDITSSWIIFYNQSTVNIFGKNQLLTYVNTTGRLIKVHCNAGMTQA